MAESGIEQLSSTRANGIMSSFLLDLVAGTCAGVSSTVFGHPLDTIKVWIFKNEHFFTIYIDSNAAFSTEDLNELLYKKYLPTRRYSRIF